MTKNYDLSSTFAPFVPPLGDVTCSDGDERLLGPLAVWTPPSKYSPYPILHAKYDELPMDVVQVDDDGSVLVDIYRAVNPRGRRLVGRDGWGVPTTKPRDPQKPGAFIVIQAAPRSPWMHMPIGRDLCVESLVEAVKIRRAATLSEKNKRERLAYYQNVLREPGVYLPDFEPAPEDGWRDALDLAVEAYRDNWPEKTAAQVQELIESELLDDAHQQRRVIAEEIGAAAAREEGLVKLDLRRIVLPPHEEYHWVGSLVRPLKGRSVALLLPEGWDRRGRIFWEHRVVG